MTYLFLLAFAGQGYEFIETFSNPIDCSSTAIKLTESFDNRIHKLNANILGDYFHSDYICIEVLK